jgi:hypothetical protein
MLFWIYNLRASEKEARPFPGSLPPKNGAKVGIIVGKKEAGFFINPWTIRCGVQVFI